MNILLLAILCAAVRVMGFIVPSDTKSRAPNILSSVSSITTGRNALFSSEERAGSGVGSTPRVCARITSNPRGFIDSVASVFARDCVIFPASTRGFRRSSRSVTFCAAGFPIPKGRRNPMSPVSNTCFSCAGRPAVSIPLPNNPFLSAIPAFWTGAGSFENIFCAKVVGTLRISAFCARSSGTEGVFSTPNLSRKEAAMGVSPIFFMLNRSRS